MEFELLWKAQVTIHDGEFEYDDDIFIRGTKDEEEALKEARYQAQHWMDAGEKAEPYDDRENTWEEPRGYRLIELQGVRKIETLEELLSALYVVDIKEHPDTIS